MLSSSRLSSLTPCPVTHSPDHASFLQPPPSPFLLINCARSLHQPQTVADTGSEPTSRSLSPPQPGFATHSGNSSHMNLPETPIRVASQPSCPPAPKRHPPLRLYGGDSTNDTGGTCDGTSDNTARPSRGNSRDPRPHLPAGTDDTAASLRQMVATAAAVSSPQDMLCRLRPDAPKVAHPEMAHSAGSLPVLAIPVPGCLQTYDNPSTLRARRLKLFGQARSSFLTIKCLCSSSTEVLPPASSQPRPLTIRTDPPTVQTDSPTDRTDLVGFAKRHSSGLPGRCVALRTQSDPGFSYPHKMRRPQLAADLGRRRLTVVSSVVSRADSSSPTDASAAELASAPKPASAPRGDTGTGRLHHFPTDRQQQRFLTTFDLPLERSPLPPCDPSMLDQQWSKAPGPL